MTRRETKSSSRGMQRIVEALRVYGPMDLYQLADKAFLSKNVLISGNYTNVLKAEGLIHICEYRHNPKGGRPRPIYSYGPGENAPIPPLLTPEQVKENAHRADRNWRMNGGSAKRQADNKLKKLASRPFSAILGLP